MSLAHPHDRTPPWQAGLLVTTLLLSLLLPARLSAAGSSYLVKDIYPGGFGGDPHQMITINGLLYFEATDDIYGMELWKSDGTATGTSLVKDINPGAASAFDAYSDWVLGLTPIGDTLYFVADDGSHGRELWKSDGTTNGTVRITDLNPGVGHAFNSYATPQFTYISQLQPINQQLFFTATDGVHGFELWQTDGTSQGTSRVRDINPGASNSFPFALTNMRDTLFFFADDGVHGIELWRSNGTETTTSLVKNINLGQNGAFITPYWASQVIRKLSVNNGAIVFAANDGVHGVELWKSDGSTAGTRLVKDLYPGPNSSLEPTFMSPFWYSGTRVIMFRADDGQHGVELWKTDGSSAGTVLLQDLDPGAGSSYAIAREVNGTWFITGSIGSGPNTNRVWRSDGTPSGTTLLVDMPAAVVADAAGTLLLVVNGSAGMELWTSDGTPTGTHLLEKLGSGIPGTGPSDFFIVDHRVFFQWSTVDTGQELWALPLSALGIHFNYLPLI